MHSQTSRGGAVVARWAHNPKVVGSSPPPATTQGLKNTVLLYNPPIKSNTTSRSKIRILYPPLLKLQKKRFNLSPARSTTGYYKTAKKKDLYPTSFLKLVLPSSPAFCNAKYRGELRSVATRRGIKNTCNGSNRVNPPLPLCFRKGI